MNAPSLELRGVSAGYAGVPVVRNVDLRVDDGQVVALLGPNGAGKTTTLLAAAGRVQRLGGEVRLFGEPTDARGLGDLVKAGLGLVPQERALFHRLTVVENLRLAAPPRKRHHIEEALGHFPALVAMRDRKVALLSGGEQQMLALARALVTRPRLLVVDELSLGLAPIVVSRLAETLLTLARETGTAVLLVEQHVELALGMADHAYVLRHGEVVVDEPAAALRSDPDRLHAAYFGPSAA